MNTRRIRLLPLLAVLVTAALPARDPGPVEAAAGDPDTSFGDGAIATADLGEGWGRANALAPQPDGKIVVTGRNSDGSLAVLRFNADGSLDATFADADNCSGAVASAKAPEMRAARAALIAAFGQPHSGSFTHLSGTATLTGVGFFDFLHGQTGVAPNGIELHPVMAFSR